VKGYVTGKVHYEGDVVAHEGSTFQALCDTAQSPEGQDWQRLAAAGRDGGTPEIRGTYQEAESYKKFDVVALNGSSFIARRDNPATCPGPDWQLIASCGKPGKPGQKGERGERGERGIKGDPGVVPYVVSWKIDRVAFSITATMSDGSKSPVIDMRPLFEQFQSETR
jgi:hypothetical protein